MAFSLPSIGYISEMTRSGAPAMLRSCEFSPNHVAGKRGEALLAHIRFRRDRRDQAAHQLQVPVDIALELGAQKIYLGQHIRTRDLVCHETILIVRKNAAARNHDNGDRRWDIRRRENGLAYVAVADPKKGQGFYYPIYMWVCAGCGDASTQYLT